MSNKQPFDKLTSKQRVALISILTGDDLERTAYLARVTERTIRRWRNLPIFQEALAEARRDFFTACRSHLNVAVADAFQSLLYCATGASTHGDRIKAALSLLDRVDHSEMSAKPLPEERSSQQNQQPSPDTGLT